MKHFFTLCLLAGSVAAYAQAPITITAAQFPASAATIDRFQPAAATGVTAPLTGANRSWDYRNLAPLGAVAVNSYFSAGSTPPFAGSVRAYSFSLPLGPFNIAATAYEGFDAQGFSQLGAAVAAQTFPLSTVTGAPGDVLAIPAQNIVVNNLRTPLPLTATTRVVRTSRVVSNSSLTVLLLALNQASFRYVQRTTTVDSVAGWGTVRIPVAGSAAGSGAIPALLVQRRVIAQDSFYLNNQPASAFLLTALGQSQGAISREYSQFFYRQNATQPVLVLQYDNSSFASPTGVAYSAEATVPLAVAASREVATGGLSAWPNPAVKGQALHFTLATAAPAQPLRLTLRDATGRVVLTAVAPNGQPVSLPALPAGLYLAEAEAANGAHASRRVVVE